MEKNKINMEELLSEKEKSINNENLYFYLGILDFIYYINYFPKLKNEEINRLSYYFKRLYGELSEININIIEILIQDRDILESILTILPGEKPSMSLFFETSFITLIIVLSSYSHVINLISKNNVFTKKVEYKIGLIVDSVKKSFTKYINKIKQKKTFTIKDIYNLTNSVLNNRYYNLLVERQKLRFDGVNLQEYKNKVDIFEFFSDKNGILSSYNKMKTKTRFEYEYNFFKDLPKLLEGIENILKNREINVSKN